MPIDLKIISLLVGGAAGLYLLNALLWSIAFPQKRIWPPEIATIGIKLSVWIATITIFSASFVLGILDWNSFDWSAPIRWGIGLPLILIGNITVWSGVLKIGLGATSGEVDTLKTDGLYAWSRNPQYVADSIILIGWGVLAASAWALPILVIGILVLTVAPLAEEP